MTDEEYVRSVWYSGSVMSLARIYIDGDWEWFGSWSAAAKFTRERLEQVRQLRAEIAEMADIFAHRECLEHVGCIRRRARRARILSRLESALATLTAGMKPEALQ